MDKNFKTFIIYMSDLNIAELLIYFSRIAQIAALQWDNALTKILTEYSDYADVFSSDLAIELPENTSINEHTIKLIEGKQPSYKLIYTLSPVELETLKTYIETYLKTGFIQPSRFLARASILFDKKLDGSLRLCINYWCLNNLTIKNQYIIHLICESLGQFGRAKQFTQPDLTSAYPQIKIQEDNKWKTAYCIRYSHFEYQVMSFGLSNTSASFQSYINKIFAQTIFVVMYLDDIFIYTKDLG